MGIYESAEDYLEAILRLRLQHGTVRSVNVAADLGVSKPSVSVAMKKLRESGHVEMDEDGHLSLTPQGEQVAQRIFERHRVLTGMLTALGVERETAAQEACKIEHVISEETFDRLRQHFEEKTC